MTDCNQKKVQVVDLNYTHVVCYRQDGATAPLPTSGGLMSPRPAPCKCGHSWEAHRDTSLDEEAWYIRYQRGICEECETCAVYIPRRLVAR